MRETHRELISEEGFEAGALNKPVATTPEQENTILVTQMFLLRRKYCKKRKKAYLIACLTCLHDDVGDLGRHLGDQVGTELLGKLFHHHLQNSEV